ncbi:hypothetical protein ACJA25_01940 [Mycoplasmopsis hyopharyngis]
MEKDFLCSKLFDRKTKFILSINNEDRVSDLPFNTIEYSQNLYDLASDLF